MKRRAFCVSTAVMVGAGAVARPGSAAAATSQVTGPPSADIAQIYELQAAFHQAKTAQDLELMMSLWASDGTLSIQGNPKPYTGADQLRGYWLNSGSFKNKRFSLVPSYKTRIAVHGSEADLYFECHDVGDFDSDTRAIVNDTFLSGTLRNVDGKWLFYSMSAGPSKPLSFEKYYA